MLTHGQNKTVFRKQLIANITGSKASMTVNMLTMQHLNNTIFDQDLAAGKINSK